MLAAFKDEIVKNQIMVQKKQKAVVGDFTGQKILNEVGMGKDKIVLPYYFTEVPKDVFGATLAYTQQPRIVDESGEKDSVELVNELHDHLSLWLQDYVPEEVDFKVEQGEESHDIVEKHTFYLENTTQGEKAKEDILRLEYGNPDSPFTSGSSIIVLFDEEEGYPAIDSDDCLEFIDSQTPDPFFINHLDFIEWDQGVANRYNYDYAAIFHVK